MRSLTTEAASHEMAEHADEGVDALLDELDGLLADSPVPARASALKPTPISGRPVVAVSRPSGGDDIDSLLADMCATSPPRAASSHAIKRDGPPARPSGVLPGL